MLVFFFLFLAAVVVQMFLQQINRILSQSRGTDEKCRRTASSLRGRTNLLTLPPRSILSTDGWSFLCSARLFNHPSITHSPSLLPPPCWFGQIYKLIPPTPHPADSLRPSSDSIRCPITQCESIGAEVELLPANKEPVVFLFCLEAHV